MAPPHPPLSDISLEGLYALLRPITVSPSSSGATFYNWGRTFRCTPLSVFEPETEYQCELILELARREGQTVRAVGVGHSPSDLACTKGYMVKMQKMNMILEVRSIPDQDRRECLRGIFHRLSPSCSLTPLFAGQCREALRMRSGRYHTRTPACSTRCEGPSHEQSWFHLRTDPRRNGDDSHPWHWY